MAKARREAAIANGLYDGRLATKVAEKAKAKDRRKKDKAKLKEYKKRISEDDWFGF